MACSGPGLSRPVLRWHLRRERLLYDPAPGARPWLLWLLAGCCEVWYCHWRLRSGRPRPVLSVSRILLSVLLFAGAITSLLGGRLDSVRILAQNVGAGWVLIKRFPSPNQIDEPFVETELDLGRREIRTFVLNDWFHKDPRELLLRRESRSLRPPYPPSREKFPVWHR